MTRTVWVVGGFVYVSGAFFFTIVGAVGHALLATPSPPGRPPTPLLAEAQLEPTRARTELAMPQPADKRFPYAECGKILEGLRRASGDPKSVEVTDWGEPNPPPLKNNGNEVGTKYRDIVIRARNGLGAMQVQRLHLFVKASGECAVTATDWHPTDPIDPTNFHAK